uniref:Uncharacterized protein n=1 Tax=Siphoviridae sp. ct9Dg3 TaxID=2827792 RepID=A0A8S5TLZ4_9CAUD|nr:MAG TPA: hypothetical protein [Siphoviridae sp. ct9Dg3]
MPPCLSHLWHSRANRLNTPFYIYTYTSYICIFTISIYG